MPTYSDRYRHYLFAPGALEGSHPYIDKLTITYTNLNFSFLSDDLWSSLLRGLPSLLFRRVGSGLKVKADWLFSGALTRDYASEREHRGVRGQLEIRLNPTRILQGLGSSTDLRRFDLLRIYPSEYLRKSVARANLRNAELQTLNGADNFLTDDVLGLRGLGPEFLERTVYIVRAVREAVIDSLRDILQLTEELSSVDCEAARRIFETSSWSVGQLEFFWEHRTQNAIEKMAQSIATFERVLPSSWTRPFLVEREWDRNRRYVAGSLEHNDLQAKLYAKTHNILRFEIAYNASPRTVEGTALRSFQTRDRTDRDLFELLDATATCARNRALGFWDQFWEDQIAEPTPMRARFLALIDAVHIACQSDGSIRESQVISLLLDRGGISLTPAFQSISEHLIAAGVLRRHRRSRNNRNIFLRLTPAYRSVVETLAARLDEASAPSPATTLADQAPHLDPTPRRRRHVFDVDT